MNNYYTLNQNEAFYWPSSYQTNNKLLNDSGISSNWKYRQYMQKNANDIMKYNAMESIRSSGNNPYVVENTSPVGNTPFLYKSVHDTNKPIYGQKESDLKNDYITKERMKSRMISPSIPTNF